MSDKLVVARTIAEVRLAVREARARSQIVGLVPTMGALHEGHVRLIEASRTESDFVVVSIFVNPTQFGPNEDFSRYPRTFDADLEKCEAGGASLVFAPGVEELYPANFAKTYIDLPNVSTVLEGASRPGHFQGVATVVMKLFQIVLPDYAYFGEKDFQQLLVIRRMTADLNVPVEIRGVPTVREPDGLAMSSRNRYLNPEERLAAASLSAALREASAAVLAGERDADRIRQILRSSIEFESLAKIDYVEVADPTTLAPVSRIVDGTGAVALLAVRIGSARLIDNAMLGDRHQP